MGERRKKKTTRMRGQRPPPLRKRNPWSLFFHRPPRGCDDRIVSETFGTSPKNVSGPGRCWNSVSSDGVSLLFIGYIYLYFNGSWRIWLLQFDDCGCRCQMEEVSRWDFSRWSSTLLYATENARLLVTGQVVMGPKISLQSMRIRYGRGNGRIQLSYLSASVGCHLRASRHGTKFQFCGLHITVAGIDHTSLIQVSHPARMSVRLSSVRKCLQCPPLPVRPW